MSFMVEVEVEGGGGILMPQIEVFSHTHKSDRRQIQTRDYLSNQITSKGNRKGEKKSRCGSSQLSLPSQTGSFF